jgi:hypothetical protein
VGRDPFLAVPLWPHANGGWLHKIQKGSATGIPVFGRAGRTFPGRGLHRTERYCESAKRHGVKHPLQQSPQYMRTNG